MSVDALMVLVAVMWVTTLHELLHIVGFLILRVNYRVSVICWHRIPIAISLDSAEFGQDFEKLPAKIQAKYAVIASLPYFVIVPLFMWLGGFGRVMMFISLIVIVTHGINYGLEFVDIRGALRSGKRP